MSGSFRQSILALMFNFGSLLAGFLIALNIWAFEISGWMIMVYPGVMSVRGAVAGLASGHISTGLNLGVIKDSFLENTEEFYSLLGGVMLSSIVGGTVFSTVLAVLSLLIGVVDVLNALFIVAFVLSTLMTATLITFPFTAFVGFQAFKRGLDPDYLVYPIMSSTADIIVTALYLLMALAYTRSPTGFLTYWAVLQALYLLLVALLVRGRLEETVELLRESIVMLILVALIVHVAGAALGGIYGVLGRHPGIYMVYPALLSTAGDAGSILGSRATTKIALGEISLSPRSLVNMAPEFLGIWASAATVYAAFGIVAGLVGTGSLIWLVEKLMLLALLAVPVVCLTSFLIAIGAALRGWNPDSFVNPIESASADALTAALLYLVVTI